MFAVDIGASLFNPRDPRLRKLTALMQTERPDLVVGDFNSRRRSRALCPLPGGFEHAYDAAGSGWSYTWPVPCPVLAIDQCIVGTRITPVMYELTSTLRSDHRMQTLDFIVNANGKNN